MNQQAQVGAPVLLVEDSDEDYEVTMWALRRAGLARPTVRCRRADEASAMLLSGESASPDQTAPCVVLLDLNLPDESGQELMERLNRAQSRPAVPIVVLSTSTNPRDVERCYRLGAAGYLRKPLDLEAFARQMRRFVDYWFGTAILPQR